MKLNIQWYYPSMFLIGVSDTPSHTPWSATLVARSQLLGKAGGPYFGSARSYDPSLTLVDTSHLLILAFWPRQETAFEASERNKEASHAPIARKLTLA